MNHPHELLAEYVDGSLPQRERTAVEAHLEGCDECRHEIVLARGARRALRSLPSLVEIPVPADVAAPALAEASTSSRAATSAGTTPRWYRAGGLAAAAAIVVVLAVTLPRLGQSPTGSRDPLGAAEAAAPAKSEPAVEVQGTNYTRETLAKLAAGSRTAAGSAPTEASFAEDGAVGSSKVLHCLRAAYPHIEGTPVRLIRARFQGTPAYVGVFQSAYADDASNKTITLAASTEGCQLLSFSSAKI